MIPADLAVRREKLLQAARDSAANAYAPYSRFHVGAALLLSDGSVITGANVENASYGLSLCAETVAAAKLLSEPREGALVAVAVTGGPLGGSGERAVVTPCGRCRQVLNEVAQQDGTDPVIWCDGDDAALELHLSDLLPRAFGPASLT